MPPKYLIQDESNYIYPYTDYLAERTDMRPYDGPIPGQNEAKPEPAAVEETPSIDDVLATFRTETAKAKGKSKAGDE